MKNKLLTLEDVASLTTNPSLSEKRSTLKKISHYYNSEEITQKERKLAEDIFRLMVEDVDVQVRVALSESLKFSKKIPQDIIKKIITNQNNVAVPFIRYYSDLSQNDMISIIDSSDIKKQKAVASRTNLNSAVSQYILEHCSQEVIDILTNNNPNSKTT